MSEERVKILKMVKEGRITIEEAELLLDALSQGEEPTAEGGSGQRQEEPAKEEELRDQRRARHPRVGPSWLDLDFGFDFSKLRPGLEEAVRGMEQPIRDFVKNLGGMDFDWKLGRVFGKVSAQETKEKSLSAAGISALQLTNTWGNVVVRGGTGTEVGIVAQVSAWAANSLDAQRIAEGIEILHYREGSTLVVKHRSPDEGLRPRYKVDFELTVPAALAVELRGMSGDLSLEETTGDARLLTLSGDIRVEAVTGRIAADSKSGEVEISRCSGDIEASTLSGDLSLLEHHGRAIAARAVSGDVRAELYPADASSVELRSVSGDVRLKLPRSAAVEINAETTSGEVDCGLPLDYAEHGSRRVRGVMGSPDGRVRISTKSGSIALRSFE